MIRAIKEAIHLIPHKNKDAYLLIMTHDPYSSGTLARIHDDREGWDEGGKRFEKVLYDH